MMIVSYVDVDVESNARVPRTKFHYCTCHAVAFVLATAVPWLGSLKGATFSGVNLQGANLDKVVAHFGAC
eukprot:6114159-Pleurochrysis_carterae.AAC.1